MEDDQEIASFMFRRTVPSAHLTPDDIRWMVMSLDLCTPKISLLVSCSHIFTLAFLKRLASTKILSVICSVWLMGTKLKP